MVYIITPEHLAAIAGKATPLMADLAKWMNKVCPSYEIDTPQEHAHFLAQACHETDRFRTLREYASGQAYEGRAVVRRACPAFYSWLWGTQVRGRYEDIERTPAAFRP